MNIRAKMAEKTANLRRNPLSTESKPATPPRPQTGPGMLAALTEANQRVQELETQAAKTVVPVAQCKANRWQPRLRFDKAALTELADSIRHIGLIQPIVVRKVLAADGSVDFYELVAGERRLRAHVLNEMEFIEAKIIDLSDQDMAVLALTENIVREDLSDYEISKSIKHAEAEFQNRSAMADAMGVGRSDFYRLLSFEKLPEFILKDLDENPKLLGGTAANHIVAALAKYGTAAEPIAVELWAQLKSGSLEQLKFHRMLDHAFADKHSESATKGGRDIHKLYAGKSQAGSITKDDNSFILKLKTTALTEAQEARIRELVKELYPGK